MHFSSMWEVLSLQKTYELHLKGKSKKVTRNEIKKTYFPFNSVSLMIVISEAVLLQLEIELSLLVTLMEAHISSEAKNTQEI